MPDVHLINHTHWDREWFLTHEYTTAWVPALIDSLEQLAETNPDYEFLFDGQTLAIEDLLGTRPEYEDRVRELISAGQLEIGPCYSQPDWRMVSGELHVRNLLYGMGDAERHGGRPTAAWLVDTFGHISQAPQLLMQAGLDAAYVWRGVPEMEPVFRWRSPDGTELMTIDLFGGYRNLYGITKTPEIAVDRLSAETHKLASHYDELPVPLFDGYDLDTEPEDPFRWYGDLDIPDGIRLHASSPSTYVEAVRSAGEHAPVIAGELLSGKYGSTFPGSLSGRSYLKVMHHDAERALHRVVEPLAALARHAGAPVDFGPLERANRTLLQNGVHDCLCGVSIDQVHERMERSYRELLEWANDQQRVFATAAMSGFAAGTYAVSTNPMPIAQTLRIGNEAVRVATTGVGITQVEQRSAVTPVDEPAEAFTWANDHYEAQVDAHGIFVDGGRIVRLVVREDAGDTYSSEPGQVLGELTPSAHAQVRDRTDLDITVVGQWSFEADEISVEAEIEARFDDSPTVGLTVRLDSTGVGFRVDAEFDTGVASDTVQAGMPFDLVERPHEDNDLFGSEIDAELAAILMGQRETELVTEYPFHDLVALSDETTTRAVLARGLRAYRSDSAGTIRIGLRRAVEWLAKTGLRYRIGDAGPAMYVPGARSERLVEHQLGYVSTTNAIELRRANEAFQNPPTIVEVSGPVTDGASSWTAFTAPVPASTLTLGEESAALRLYNPLAEPAALGSPLPVADLRGTRPRTIEYIDPGAIVTTMLDLPPLPAAGGQTVTVRSSIENRVEPSRSRPDAAVLETLSERIAKLESELRENEAELSVAEGSEHYRLTHREYVLDRERLELMLSLELNRRRAATDDEVSIPDEPDPVIAKIGAELNDLRVKRRIWDYVVQALATNAAR